MVLDYPCLAYRFYTGFRVLRLFGGFRLRNPCLPLLYSRSFREVLERNILGVEVFAKVFKGIKNVFG